MEKWSRVLMEVDFRISMWSAPGLWWGGRSLLPVGRDESPSSLLIFSETILVGVLGHPASWGWKCSFSFGVWVRMEVQFFLCCLADAKWFLSKNVFVSLGCPFSGLLDGDSWFSLGLFCLISLAFLVADFCPKSKIYEAKENPGNSPSCCYWDTEVPGQFIFFSPISRVFLCLFYIYCPVFLVVLVGIIWKSVRIASFWMWTFLKLWKTFCFHLPVINTESWLLLHTFFFNDLFLFYFESSVFLDCRVSTAWDGVRSLLMYPLQLTDSIREIHLIKTTVRWKHWHS